MIDIDVLFNYHGYALPIIRSIHLSPEPERSELPNSAIWPRTI